MTKLEAVNMYQSQKKMIRSANEISGCGGDIYFAISLEKMRAFTLEISPSFSESLSIRNS